MQTFDSSVRASIVASAQDGSKEPRKQRVITRFWPTEASAMSPKGPVGRCRRRTYYSQQALPEPVNDAETIGRFQIGHIIESWIRETIRSQNLEFKVVGNNQKLSYPIPCNPRICISGEIDLIYKIGDELVGGEIKSSSGYTFQNTVFHKKTIPGMPKVEHVLQVALYLYYTKFINDPEKIDILTGIDRFLISYYDRSDCSFAHHLIELGSDLVPIVNGIKLSGISDYTNPILNGSGFNSQKTYEKLLPYQVDLHDVFRRFDEIFSYNDSGLLVPRDFCPLFTEDQIADRRASGEISKSRFADYDSGKVAYLCDSDCSWCPFREQCMKDDGLI